MDGAIALSTTNQLTNRYKETKMAIRHSEKPLPNMGVIEFVSIKGRLATVVADYHNECLENIGITRQVVVDSPEGLDNGEHVNYVIELHNEKNRASVPGWYCYRVRYKGVGLHADWVRRLKSEDFVIKVEGEEN